MHRADGISEYDCDPKRNPDQKTKPESQCDSNLGQS